MEYSPKRKPIDRRGEKMPSFIADNTIPIYRQSFAILGSSDFRAQYAITPPII